MTQARWERITEWPLALVAVAFLVAYSWEVIGDLQGWRQIVAEAVQWGTWAVFLADYAVNLSLAERRGWWFRHHLVDLLSVVLPFLRPLRLLRLVSLLALLRRGAGRAFRGRVVIYVIGATILLVWVAAVAMLDAERDQGGTIRTIWDALWWACATIMTVGYGDVTPVTVDGRLIAVAVMIGGIALIGVVTATLASWIVERVNADEERREEAIEVEERREETTLTITAQELAEIRDELRALREALGHPAPPVDS